MYLGKGQASLVEKVIYWVFGISFYFKFNIKKLREYNEMQCFNLRLFWGYLFFNIYFFEGCFDSLSIGAYTLYYGKSENSPIAFGFYLDRFFNIDIDKYLYDVKLESLAEVYYPSEDDLERYPFYNSGRMFYYNKLEWLL